MGLKATLISVVVTLFLLTKSSTILTTKFSTLENQEVLFVTAHPDDETMFFGPTLAYVRSAARHNNVYFLVMSNGDADGIGETRAQEMREAARLLGVTETQVTIVNDERLQDGMDTQWDPDVVARYVSNAIKDTNAGTVITFDSHGISGHPNHRAVYAGCVRAAAQFAATNSHFQLLTLYSVPLWRKYLFSLDAVISKVVRFGDVKYTIVSGSRHYALIKHALAQGHASQMTWYRRLWAYFSRYMVVNDLSEVDLERVAARDDTQLAEQIRLKRSEREITNLRTAAVKPPRTRTGVPTHSRFKPVTTLEKRGATAAPEPEEEGVSTSRAVTRHIRRVTAHDEL